MILQIVAEIANQFQQIHPSVNFTHSKERLNNPMPDTRIIWYPTNDSFSPTQNPGHNDLQVRTREVGLNFDIFSKDMNAIDQMINDLIVSIYTRIFEPQLIDLNGQWLDQGSEDQQGFGYRLSLTISCVIKRRPRQDVTILTVNKISGFDGSVEVIDDTISHP